MKNYIIHIGAFVIAIIFFVNIGCNQFYDEAKFKKKNLPDLGQIDALPLDYKSPEDNPTSNEKIELGKLLFYDPILSGNKDVSCATCHHPEFGYAESLEVSIGVNGMGLGEKRVFIQPNNIPFTKRNSQSILNTAFNGIDINGEYDPLQAPMFWDIREKSLEGQAIHPIKQLEEMRGRSVKENVAIGVIIQRIKSIAEYNTMFAVAFNTSDAVNEINLGKTLACFERSLLANNSRFDQYMRGDKNALSIAEIDGMKLFIKSGCARCHSGPMLSDFKTHVMGVEDNEKIKKADSGFDNRFAFRTPSLRNLRFTSPYMHSGKIKKLEDVLTFYEDLPGATMRNNKVNKSELDTLAKILNVDFRDISRIVEFLNTLNDSNYDRKIPTKVPSGLPVAGNIN